MSFPYMMVIFKKTICRTSRRHRAEKAPSQARIAAWVLQPQGLPAAMEGDPPLALVGSSCSCCFQHSATFYHLSCLCSVVVVESCVIQSISRLQNTVTVLTFI